LIPDFFKVLAILISARTLFETPTTEIPFEVHRSFINLALFEIYFKSILIHGKIIKKKNKILSL